MALNLKLFKQTILYIRFVLFYEHPMESVTPRVYAGKVQTSRNTESYSVDPPPPIESYTLCPIQYIRKEEIMKLRCSCFKYVFSAILENNNEN